MLVEVRLLSLCKTCIPCANLGLWTVIGRGGETINRLQNESGCRIQVSQGMSRTAILALGTRPTACLHPLDVGQPERPIQLVGTREAME
jgi:hypothetical protein